MPHTYKYELCHELTDCSLSEPWATYPTKRVAIQVARHAARSPIFDATAVVVMDSVYQTVVAVFPVLKHKA